MPPNVRANRPAIAGPVEQGVIGNWHEAGLTLTNAGLFDAAISDNAPRLARK
ncbi:hypothetical protein D3C78_1842680 [compost metagenome]